ncbi:MAG: hypothetical protein JWQ17_1673 [Tardiphaga sp.]|jgi:hypothetical protein|nr:hypothetical protein [Tardiphaga sp.]
MLAFIISLFYRQFCKSSLTGMRWNGPTKAL